MHRQTPPPPSSFRRQSGSPPTRRRRRLRRPRAPGAREPSKLRRRNNEPTSSLSVVAVSGMTTTTRCGGGVPRRPGVVTGVVVTGVAVVVVVAAVVVVAVAGPRTPRPRAKRSVDPSLSGCVVSDALRNGADLVLRGLARHVEHATRGGRVRPAGPPPADLDDPAGVSARRRSRRRKRGGAQRPTSPMTSARPVPACRCRLERDPAPRAFLAKGGASQPGHPLPGRPIF